MLRIVVAAAVALLAVGCGDDDTTPEPPHYDVMESALLGLGGRFPEATDTAVRDRVLLSVYCAVVHGDRVSTDFGMFSAEGDRAVRARVLSFVRAAHSGTPELDEDERVDAIWGDDWGENVYLVPNDCRRG